MDKCRQCGSVHLVRRLGEVECRDCGMTVSPDSSLAAEPVGPSAVRAPGLSEEVALALERVLRRGADG
jgi:hypothetical protein